MWPTPAASDDNKSPEAHMAMKQRMKGGPRNTITSLQVKVQLWQTPSVAVTLGGNLTRGGNRADEPLLRGQAKLWPTAAGDGHQTRHMGGNLALGGAAQLWPTDAMPSLPAQATTGQLGSPTGLVLNPRFVEMLMGWPFGMTSLESSETESYQQWLQRHSAH